ncbi:hypothetical protein [Streptomyces sp. NPDC001970]
MDEVTGGADAEIGDGRLEGWGEGFVQLGGVGGQDGVAAGEGRDDPEDRLAVVA